MARDMKFPRPGSWAVWLRDGAEVLGVINRIGKEDVERVSEPHPTTGEPQPVNKTVLRVDEPFAEFHTVETADGENHGTTTGEHKNVPFDQLRQATYAEMLTQRRAGDVTPLYAHRRGYDIGDELRAQIPDMERAEALEIARASAIAEHPDIVNLDEQRNRDMAAIEAKYAELRSQAAATIDADAEIRRKVEERAARQLAATSGAVAQATGTANAPVSSSQPAPPAAGA